MTRVWREHDVDTTFRRAHRYIDGNETKVIGAFPVLTFKPDNSFDLIFVKETAGAMTSYSDIHQNDSALIFLHEQLQGSNIIDGDKTYVTAFPIHEFRDSTVGAILLSSDAVEVKHIHWNALGLPRLVSNWSDMVIAFNIVDDYAVANNFAGGFLDCHLIDEHRRLFLFKKDYFERKSIPEWRLNHLTNFRYNFCNPPFEARIRKAHNIICSILDANSCNVLTERDTLKLKEMYYNNLTLSHFEDNNMPTLGGANINCPSIYFNINRLSSADDISIARIVFHELMHTIGYDHPADENDPAYKASVPHRVIFCIPSNGDSNDAQIPIPNFCQLKRDLHCPT
ncbi:hypothetical protein [Brevibacillus sp. DP1.3A]|uniref:hypothetical protein n=1 Tax=Brevibacillus sp. DP1.3A TaxID=2738867 RepID=UPI00156A9490|nr:hypothetical protein [Brevibacillus sp. DP1.3A]MED1919504.1 hypothetical protein [Bacillus thuringiensis]UED77474.1 hypothetical protein HP399_013730 [Brevibacillus sp. DP1.3A]